MLPLLQLAADDNAHALSETVEKLSDFFRLTPEEVAELLPSGKYPRFRQRVGWAKTYLNKAQLLEYAQRGAFEITERGRSLLAEKPERIDIRLLMRYPEFKTFREASLSSKETATGEPTAADEKPPREILEASFLEIKQTLADELLARAKTNSPEFFQQLVIDLLTKMYGGSLTDAGQVVGGSGDRGIDGIVKQDPLGLDAVYVQAKRFSDTTVGSEIVRNFAGSLLQHKASKGVLITTSRFSPEARKAAESMDKRIVLVDGPMLAELLIDNGVGVIDDQTFIVRRMDVDYFDN
jgi:restriction system protein